MSAPATLSEAIEAIEAGYEFCLAYAAQGFEGSQNGPHQADVRKHLSAMAAALANLDELAGQSVGNNEGFAGFIATLATDATRASGVVELVLAADGISSQLIDNFNASTHIRTVLTDLFLLDEAVN